MKFEKSLKIFEEIFEPLFISYVIQISILL